MPFHALVGSRVAVIDRAPFPALQRIPAPAAPAQASSAAGSNAPRLPDDAWRALVVSALWLHVGLIGALSVAAGLVLLVAGEAAPLPALGAAIAGGAIALLAWRRGRRVLERHDRNRSRLSLASGQGTVTASMNVVSP